jgi:hypothetical protein
MEERKTSTEAVRAFRAKRRAELGEDEVKRIQREEARRYRAENPHAHLASNHKIPTERAKFLYAAMREASCEICGGDTGRVLFDHNHKTGEFRGFLCYACNSGVGQFHDDPELLEKAIKYLRDRSN